MFPDYQAQVLLAYQKKREAGQLSLNLLHPSPAQLRKECLLVLRDRYLKKDSRFISDFFEVPASETEYAQFIDNIDIDKFKPLLNFISLKTSDPVRKHVELLAWLIDFEPRPYKFGQTPVAEEDITKKIEEEKKDEAEVEKIPTGELPKVKKFRAALLVLVILACSGGGSYWLWGKMAGGGCAIWTGDRYRAVPCEQRTGNTSVVVVDEQRLAQFQLITRPDTVTSYSIGRSWYFKRNDSLELYTAGGIHPAHNERVLKKLTGYMFKKYVLPKKVYRTSF